jgi:MFS-type transporter involved in bile tolerance (Atg22 family)
MLAGAGVDNVHTELLLVGVLGIIGFIGTAFGAFLTDRIRRRTQLITGNILCTILITIATVLNATNIRKTAKGLEAKSEVTSRAQIALLLLFTFTFTSTWSPNQMLYPVECLRFETRAKGLSLYYVCLIFNLIHIDIPY